MEYAIGSATLALATIAVALIQTSRRLARLEELVAEHVSHWEDFHSRGWHRLPPETTDAVAFSMTIKSIQDGVVRMENALSHHIEWEEREKYDR